MLTPTEPGPALAGTPPDVLGLEGLHPEQRDAVTHGEGPLLIGGAGTGNAGRHAPHRVADLGE
jgi:hypothetical protein